MSVESADALIDRVVRQTRDGTYRPKVHSAPEAYDVRERTRDSVRGRSASPDHPGWRSVMGRHHFTWFPPEVLTKVVGPQAVIQSHQRQVLDISELREEVGYTDPLTGKVHRGTVSYRPHTVGQWRRTKPTAEAFSEQDLVTLFSGPENFAEWIREHTQARLNPPLAPTRPLQLTVF